MIGRMAGEVKRILRSCMELTYFMRGGTQYDRVLLMTYIERQELSDFLAERLEAENKKMHPNY